MTEIKFTVQLAPKKDHSRDNLEVSAEGDPYEVDPRVMLGDKEILLSDLTCITQTLRGFFGLQ